MNKQITYVPIIAMLLLAPSHQTRGDDNMLTEEWCCKDLSASLRSSRLKGTVYPCLVEIKYKDIPKEFKGIKTSLEGLSVEEIATLVTSFAQERGIKGTQTENQEVATEDLIELFTMIAREDIIFNSITVAGTKPQNAIKYMSGLDRQWEFGNNYEYIFVLKPNGTGLYAESGKKPSQFFHCEVNE